eukprot:4682664-Pyramimonas_sp.AAC.1
MHGVYSGIVKFNIEPEQAPLVCGTVVASHLEVDLHMPCTGVRTLMTQKNEAFAVTGDPKHYKKKSPPPLLGPLSAPILGQLR